MTEQPPPSAEALKLGGYASSYEMVMKLAVEIDALCEQRVSAETERCARIAFAVMDEELPEPYWDNARARRMDWVSCAGRIMTLIRAPAERPAPTQPAVVIMGPQSGEGDGIESPRRIDVQQQTQQTEQPGCGTSEPLPDCMMPDGAEPCRGYQALLADRDRWWADNKRLGEALINTNASLRELQTVVRERDEARLALATLQQHERLVDALREIYEAPDDLPGWVIAVCREALEGDTK